MTKRYRHHDEIVKAILEAAQGGALLSRILTKANVSTPQWAVYWPELIAEGLLDEEAGAYNTTQKGMEWLAQHEKLEEIEELEDGIAALLPRRRDH